MGDEVFVNGRSAIHAGSAGMSTAFPDVNLCPPTPPAGPIPTPLPNMAQGADLQGGASSVLIAGNPMAKKSSFLAKSTGNEVAQSTGGGVVSHVVQGKAYFVSYSFDVTVEGEEAPRHLDMLTHNHAAQSPPNSAMGTYLGAMNPALLPPAQDEQPKRKDDGKPQKVEFYLDQAGNKPAAGADSVLLVSSDEKYKQSLPLSAATKKGGLLCLTFKQVLPDKVYSLYWQAGDQKVPFFELVRFADIAEHAPGAEKPAEPRSAEPEPPPVYAPAAPGERELEGAPPEGEERPADPDHPPEWYDRGHWDDE